MVVADEFAAGLDKAGGSGTAPDPAAEAVPGLVNGHVAIVDQLTRSHQARKAATDNRHPRPRCYVQSKSHGFDCCCGLALLRCAFFRHDRLAFGAGDLLAVSAMQAAIKRAHFQKHPKSKGDGECRQGFFCAAGNGPRAFRLACRKIWRFAASDDSLQLWGESREGGVEWHPKTCPVELPKRGRRTRARAAPALPMLNPSVDRSRLPSTIDDHPCCHVGDEAHRISAFI
ncbi:MAG: hypothetical protein ABWY82_13450 [Tardiphaga sp.]